MSDLKYRPEVDGLRAVAVASVVLFHAGLGCPGGFVGVDVFFVISGYLITGLILNEGERFSLGRFWERRVRRIAPAATVMVLGCMVAGWLWLLPEDLARLGRSALANSLLLSNVYFWRDLGYFADETARPLLHTWSLAVEEQFYLALPLLLFWLRRAPRRHVIALLATAALLSFAASAYGVFKHPSAAFYLLPTRAWELLVGSLVAATPALRSSSRLAGELLSGAGLLAILVAVLGYSSSTPFPGAAALLPCSGAAAIIVGNSAAATLTGRLLSLRPLVGLGAISYSLYLWHWPVLVFARNELASISNLVALALVAFSLVLAWASWRFVEQPVRRRALFVGRPALFGAAALGSAGFLIVGAAIARSEGAPARWPLEALAYAGGKQAMGFRPELDLASAQKGELTALGVNEGDGPIELLVWGDSHAMATLHQVDAMCRARGWRCRAATHSSTAPLLGLPTDGPYSLRQDADPFRDAVVEFVRTRRVGRVLLAAAWPSYDELAELQGALRATIRALQEAGAQVAILKDVPKPDFDVPRALAKAVVAGQDVQQLGVTLDRHLALNRRINRIIDGSANPAVQVLDPTSAFCAVQRCRVEVDGRPLYFDSHHLTTHGATQLAALLEPLFES